MVRTGRCTPLESMDVTVTRGPRTPFMRWFLDAEEADPGGYYEGEREAVDATATCSRGGGSCA